MDFVNYNEPFFAVFAGTGYYQKINLSKMKIAVK